MMGHLPDDWMTGDIRSMNMTIRNRIWMTGSLDWFAYIGDEEVFLGRREVPIPLEEGDSWTNESGAVFRIEGGEIRRLGQTEPPKRFW
jgi:hypothetical protein